MHLSLTEDHDLAEKVADPQILEGRCSTRAGPRVELSQDWTQPLVAAGDPFPFTATYTTNKLVANKFGFVVRGFEHLQGISNSVTEPSFGCIERETSKSWRFGKSLGEAEGFSDMFM